MNSILMKNFNENVGNISYTTQREYDIKKIKSILTDCLKTNTLIISYGNNWVSLNGTIFNGFNETHINNIFREVQEERLNELVNIKRKEVKII